MNYKYKDKVKIKTWKSMEYEYGLSDSNNINCQYVFTKEIEAALKDINTNRIVTIEMIHTKTTGRYYYRMKEVGGMWSSDMIEFLLSF